MKALEEILYFCDFGNYGKYNLKFLLLEFGTIENLIEKLGNIL
jgi:hypothetical protein